MPKKERLLAIVCFGTLAAVILMMMAATVLEKVMGSPYAFRWVYHNPVVFVLWGIVVLVGVCLLISRATARRFWTFLLHLSFVVILGGALLTHLTGEQGRVFLPEGETVTTWIREDGQERPLPCPVTLEDFEVLYYPGSQAASDYRSRIRAGERSYDISMNHIARIGGYRFFQTGFDGSSSVLSINHDPWGIGFTYTGYALLLLSLIGFFFQRDTVFRRTLDKVVKSSAFLLPVLLFSPGEAGAQTHPRALPADVAEAFGELYVYYNDRICPFETMARDYTLKAYGKSHWEEYGACQVVTGWLFYYDWWRDVPFKLKAKDRGTVKEAEKEYILQSVASGDAWKLYPVADSSGVVRWYDSNGMLPLEVIDDYDRWVFIRKVMDVVESSVREEDWEEVKRIVGRIRDYQSKVAAPFLPSQTKISAEKVYNRLSRPLIPFMASITWGFLLFILLGLSMSGGCKVPHFLYSVSAVLATLLLAYLTVALGLRWYVSGHAPFAGSYCVMMLMAWISALGMGVSWKRFPLVLPLGFILSGFTMLMASLAGANPQVTHLMPVLQSPLLSIHVLTMMLSYTMLGLVALNGIMGLIVPVDASARLKDVSLVVLYPAVFLLVCGTFLGAVWANISWGNYWSWDPKETWALITFLVYSFSLHGTLLKPLRKPRFFHAFCLLAFLCVLITYFGVNLVLGGMHSYS
jgi:ABC-type transport system involved in cytochrome c biogenesis permease subunit